MWGIARAQAGFSSIATEWKSFKRAAFKKENGERNITGFGEYGREDTEKHPHPFQPNRPIPEMPLNLPQSPRYTPANKTNTRRVDNNKSVARFINAKLKDVNVETLRDTDS